MARSPWLPDGNRPIAEAKSGWQSGIRVMMVWVGGEWCGPAMGLHHSLSVLEPGLYVFTPSLGVLSPDDATGSPEPEE